MFCFILLHIKPHHDSLEGEVEKMLIELFNCENVPADKALTAGIRKKERKKVQ